MIDGENMKNINTEVNLDKIKEFASEVITEIKEEAIPLLILEFKDEFNIK